MVELVGVIQAMFLEIMEAMSQEMTGEMLRGIIAF